MPSKTLLLLTCLASLASAQTKTRDVVYMKAGGAAFTMDMLRPAKPNRAAVVFVVSGGWISDYSMLQGYEPDLERTFVDAGFTVFEVLHGAQPRYKVAEIVEQVRASLRFVHEHAAAYGIDPDRVGVSGISSGAHLALMGASSPDSHVRAVAAIAPPADLANWGKPGFVFTDEPQLAVFVPALGLTATTPRKELEALAKQLSPITYVNDKFPPTLFVHGDSDTVVPLQQSQSMDRALAKAGVEHKLEVIPGGGHDDKTFGPGVTKALQWFNARLLKSPAGAK
ncbi:MAG TPA: alpha/beta hydrolase [Gemmatimonadaceae bacterium]|jgi:acetyl esterase/lipase